jgi:hypothetical protein
MHNPEIVFVYKMIYICKHASLTNGVGKTGYPSVKIETRSSLASCTSFNSKWVKVLNVRFETVKHST